jgi:alanyl-tRNA synthetase
MHSENPSSCHQDSSIVSFDAHVLTCCPCSDGLTFAVTLDHSYFFPAGGGQPSDRGSIGKAELLEVTLNEGTLHHITRAPLKQGPVSCQIDMSWRRHFMEQHTGQHILSGALWQIGGHKTVSVHLGEKETTIEVDSSEISSEELQKIEYLANDIIRQNLPVNTQETSVDELHRHKLRKIPDLLGKVRLVSVGDFDHSVCCGLHLDSSAALGLVKCLGTEKIRGHLRTRWAIGAAALADYQQKHQVVTRLGQILSTGQDSLDTRATQLLEENRQQSREISELEGRLAENLTWNLLLTAADTPRGSRLITGILSEKESLVLRVVKNLLNQDHLIFCLLNPGQDKTAWTIGCGSDITLDFNHLRDHLLVPFKAKGGGRQPLWKGQLPDSSIDEQFLSTFAALLTKFQI